MSLYKIKYKKQLEPKREKPFKLEKDIQILSLNVSIELSWQIMGYT